LIINSLENIDLEDHLSHKDDMHFLVDKVDVNFYFALVYSEEELNQEIQQNMGKIARLLHRGDKFTLRTVLQAQNANDLGILL